MTTSNSTRPFRLYKHRPARTSLPPGCKKNRKSHSRMTREYNTILPTNLSNRHLSTNTRPVIKHQSFASQSGVLLNSNLGFLSRPWIFHLAASLMNHRLAPRYCTINRFVLQISGSVAPHPFPFCPRSASRANPPMAPRDMAVLPRTQPRSTETDRHRNRDLKNGQSVKIDLYIPT